MAPQRRLDRDEFSVWAWSNMQCQWGLLSLVLVRPVIHQAPGRRLSDRCGASLIAPGVGGLAGHRSGPPSPIIYRVEDCT